MEAGRTILDAEFGVERVLTVASLTNSQNPAIRNLTVIAIAVAPGPHQQAVGPRPRPPHDQPHQHRPRKRVHCGLRGTVAGAREPRADGVRGGRQRPSFPSFPSPAGPRRVRGR